MAAVVKSIVSGSPAADIGIEPFDVLHRINGKEIRDVLDYMYYSNDSHLDLEFTCKDGEIKSVTAQKPEDVDFGLEFESFLLDEQRSCENNCIFCFIDQLPKGMRESLYYKDDDLRLSFLQGNYITLTNLSRADVRRIIRLRISPINISIHTLDPKLRSLMLRNKKGASAIKSFYDLAKAGISLNCQIVCCPGVNDGVALNRTLKKLLELGSAINSVSIVPVGLTKHRDGLIEMVPFDSELALKTVRQVERFAKMSFAESGRRVFYCSDELYIMAGLRLPSNNFYEDYPQFENGVGMMRLFVSEFMDNARILKMMDSYNIRPFSIVTGVLASNYIKKMMEFLEKGFDKTFANVYTVNNDFFGESVTVSGLLTGNDIANQLEGRNLGERLLIPQNMLRSGEDVFLDDMTVDELSAKLGVPIRIVKQNGADLLDAILENALCIMNYKKKEYTQCRSL